MNYSVVIVGDDGINSLGVLRSLAKYEIKPIIIITQQKSNSMFIKKSNCKHELFVIEKDTEILLHTLNSVTVDRDTRYYIIPTSDFAFNTICTHNSRICSNCICPSVLFATPNGSDIMSKSSMYEYAEKAGFSVAKYRKIFVTEDANTETIDYFDSEYPLILKSDSICLPGCDFVVVNSKEELSEKLKQYIGSTIIIQKLICDTREIAYQGVGFGSNKNPHIAGVVKKIRTSITAKGTTTYAKLDSANNETINRTITCFIKKIGLNGIFDIELLIDQKEEVWFIECNYRNGSYGYAFTVFGENLPIIWLKNSGYPVDLDTHKKKKMITFMNDLSDIRHVIHKDISFGKWIFQFITADAHLLFRFWDQGPFWQWVRTYLKG